MGFLPAVSTSARALFLRGGSFAASEVSGGAAVAASSTSLFDLVNPTTLNHQKSLAVFYMAMSMALHFFGYEFARSATLTLFTSKSTGFSSVSSLPLALACVCPASLTLLYVYTACLDKFGPRAALRYTSVMCAIMLVALSCVISGWRKFYIPGKAVK